MGVLPWLYLARLVRNDGSVIRDGIPCSIWPAQSSYQQSGGMHRTHRGEAPLSFRDPDDGRIDTYQLLSTPNVHLELVGTGPLDGRYTVLAATPQPLGLIPHVGLDLRSRGA